MRFRRAFELCDCGSPPFALWFAAFAGFTFRIAGRYWESRDLLTIETGESRNPLRVAHAQRLALAPAILDIS
jgi:hypothetical protein